MENSVSTETKKNKYLLLIGIYLLNQFVVGSLIIIAIAKIYSNNNNLDYSYLINV